MASLQSGVLQRGRRTEGCTGEGKAVEVSHDKRNCDGDKEEENETIPDQKGKPTKKQQSILIKLSLSLTIRSIFQVFEDESITVLYMGSDRVKVLNLSLRPNHGKILALLGREYERMYCTNYG